MSGYFRIAIPIATEERSNVVKVLTMRATRLRHPYGIGIWPPQGCVIFTISLSRLSFIEFSLEGERSIPRFRFCFKMRALIASVEWGFVLLYPLLDRSLLWKSN
jgi:hypothetical protein